MTQKYTLYQCPYSQSCKCSMVNSCLGCPDFAPKDNVELAQNSHQHAQAKIPTLQECQKEVQSRIWAGGFVGTSTNIIEVVYNFICRQLSAVQ